MTGKNEVASRTQCGRIIYTVLVSMVFFAGCGGSGSDSTPPRVTQPTAEFRVGLSVSPFTSLQLSEGLTFAANGMVATTAMQLQQLYGEHGATEVFARASTQPQSPAQGVDRSLQAALEKATLASSLGLPLNIELGLFRSYGDLSCQPPPDLSGYPGITLSGEWHTLTLDEMADALRSYGSFVAAQVLATGVQVDYWDLGNEIDFGTAGVAPQPLPGACDADEGGSGWYRPPDAVDPAIGEESIASLMLNYTEEGRIAWLKTHLWPSTARLLSAVAEGVREVDPQARFATHISSAMSVDFALAFYQEMQDQGLALDQLGLSFYPSAKENATARLEEFKQKVVQLQERFGKPVFIAEYAYPAEPLMEGPYSDWDNAVEGYPLSEQGQADLLKHVIAWLRTQRAGGVRPWAPDLVLVGWEPFALFSLEGTAAEARPALAAIRDSVSQQ